MGVTADGRLLKRRTIEDEAVDVSFLDRHEEAIYHAAGRHIISVGVKDGQHGVFLATNEGKEAKPLAVAEEARRIYSLVGEPGAGSAVFYVADHGAYRDVHSLSIESIELETEYTTKEEVVRITESLDRDPAERVAVQLGSCNANTHVVVLSMDSRDVERVSGLPKRVSVEPLGWMPGTGLLLIARETGCEGPGDLYIARETPLSSGDSVAWRVSDADPLAQDVETGAVRAVASPAPDLAAVSSDPPEA